ncbi:hypothetical protein ccbrp13_55630 [Ktedonobacteria bacterium brp13]|nr:hypothetical protein ccbrp13_55630 [Ktedonobacteria bacterium brp13]
MIVLTACGGASTTTAAPKPTPKPTATPSPTAIGKTFQGKGFTIDVPRDWASQTAPGTNSTMNTSITSNTDPNIGVAIVSGTGVPYSDDAQTLNAAVNSELKTLGSSKIDTTVSSKAEVAGEAWPQAGALVTVDGTKLKVIYLGKLHMGTFYLVSILAPTQNFDQANQQFFQPMLKSFKWA